MHKKRVDYINVGYGDAVLVRRTRDPAVADFITTTAHLVIALGKRFSYNFLSPPVGKRVRDDV